MREALSSEVNLPLKCLKLIFLGLPRSGKTAFLQRYIGKADLHTSLNQATTTQPQVTDAVIRVHVEDVITSRLDKEALMLYYFLQQTNKKLVEELGGQKEQIKKKEDEIDDPDLEDMIRSWQKLLQENKTDQILEIFKGTVLVNMIDIGNSPFFLEMFPALTVGPALYLVFFDLRERLDDQHSVKYVWESGKRKKSIKHQRTVDFDIEYSHSIKEIIFRILSSLACYSPEHFHSHQTVSLVGTFLDMAGDDEACKREHEIVGELEYLNKVVLLDDEQQYQQYLHKLDGKNYVLRVDNGGGEEEIKRHRHHLESLIKRKFELQDFDIPASWLMFSVLLRRMDKPIVCLDLCQQLADRLHIKQVDQVLQLLHHHYGILMYYPEVPELKDVVICNAAILFDSISELILNTFAPNKCRSDKVRINFWQFGKFTHHDIENARTGNGLSIKQVIALLEHLNVLVKDESSSEPAYFIHAVLRTASEDRLQELSKCSKDVAPLTIRFHSGFVPVGCFSSLILQMLKCTKTHEWDWELTSDDDHEMLKNRVVFCLDGSYNVTLVSRPKRYEIHVNAIVKESDRQLQPWEVCAEVCKLVCGALDCVLEKLKRKFTDKSDTVTKYQIGFVCCREECEKSPSRILNPEQDHLMLIDSNSHEISHNQFCKCITTRKKYRLKYPQHLVWSGQVSTEYCSYLPGFINMGKPNYPDGTLYAHTTMQQDNMSMTMWAGKHIYNCHYYHTDHAFFKLWIYNYVHIRNQLKMASQALKIFKF